MSIPIYLGIDETAHAVKAAAVVRGQLQTASVREPGPFGLSIPQTSVQVPEAYLELREIAVCWNAQVASEVDPLPGTEEPDERCVPPASSGATVTGTTYVGAYPPTYYGFVGWPSLVLPPTTAFYAMRILSGLLSAAFLASALSSAATLRGSQLLGPATALGVTPLVLHLSAAVNPNGLEVATACAAFTSMLALLSIRTTVPRRLLVRTALAVIMLASIRTLGPLFAVVTVITPVIVAGGWRPVTRLWADHAVRLATTVVVLCLTVAAGFTLVVGTAVIDAPSATERSSASLALDFLKSFPSLQIDTVGRTGPITFQDAEVRTVATAWVGAVAVLAGVAMVVGRGRDRAAMLFLIAAAAVLPVVAQLASEEPIPWFGRYTLAIIVGVPIVGAWVVGRSYKPLAPALMAAGSILAVGCGAAHFITIERQIRLMAEVGAGLPYFGPMSPQVLLVAGFGATCGYAALFVALALGRLRIEPALVGEDDAPTAPWER